MKNEINRIADEIAYNGTKNKRLVDYVNEATVDRNPSLTSGTTTNAKPFQSNIDKLDQQQPGNPTTEPEQTVTVQGMDGEEELAKVLNNFGNEVEIETQSGERKRVDKSELIVPDETQPGLLQQFANGARKGFSEEVSDIKRLAGIAEEKSIVGNTNDAHRPTVQMRSKERHKRNKREYRRDAAKKKFAKNQDASSVEFNKDSAERFHRVVADRDQK